MKKKIDNFVSNCPRYVVQLFVLEVLMNSFERYLLEKLPSRGGICPHWGGSEAPTEIETLYLLNASISK